MPLLKVWEVVNGGVSGAYRKELRATGIVEYWDGSSEYFTAGSASYKPTASHESWVVVPKHFDMGENAPSGVAEEVPGTKLPQRYHMNGLVGGIAAAAAPKKKPAAKKAAAPRKTARKAPKAKKAARPAKPARKAPRKRRK
jgi:hypothetical protein